MDGDQEDYNHHQVLITADNINKTILRIIRNKIKYGWSCSDCLSQLHNLFDITGDNRIPHSSWSNVLSYLERLRPHTIILIETKYTEFSRLRKILLKKSLQIIFIMHLESAHNQLH